MGTLKDFFEVMNKWRGEGYWILMELLYRKKQLSFSVTTFQPLEKIEKALEFWVDLIGQPTEILNCYVVSKKYVPSMKKALRKREAKEKHRIEKPGSVKKRKTKSG